MKTLKTTTILAILLLPLGSMHRTITRNGYTKDASGKVIRTGKYMAIWEKRDGKYICIRDIYNDDAVLK